MYLVLASKSPRRRDLLLQAGYKIQINASRVDETVEETNPIDKVLAIAKKKGIDIFNKYLDDSEAVVISADTIVVVDDEILGKPKNIDDARQMIKKLENNKHYVYTAVYIKSHQDEDSFVEKTEVNVMSMTNEEIENYINTKEPYDKAGGYGIQGIFSQYISSINGDYYNVMGLPIAKVKQVLKKYEFTDKVYCLNCKEEVGKNDVFCNHCGTKLKSKFENQICSSCHKINNPNNKYCEYCGKELQGKVTIVFNENECMICHHINKPGVEYCESCGTILSAIEKIEKPKQQEKQDLGMTSFICGIVSVAINIYCLFFISFVPGLIAIITGAISLKRGYRGKSIIGIILGIAGILSTIVGIIFVYFMGNVY